MRHVFATNSQPQPQPSYPKPYQPQYDAPVPPTIFICQIWPHRLYHSERLYRTRLHNIRATLLNYFLSLFLAMQAADALINPHPRYSTLDNFLENFLENLQPSTFPGLQHNKPLLWVHTTSLLSIASLKCHWLSDYECGYRTMLGLSTFLRDQWLGDCETRVAFTQQCSSKVDYWSTLR